MIFWDPKCFVAAWQCLTSGPWFNIKMSYLYRKSHCGYKTVKRSSNHHNGISYAGKTSSLYWIRAQQYFIIFSSALQQWYDASIATEATLKNRDDEIQGLTIIKPQWGHKAPHLRLPIVSRVPYYLSCYCWVNMQCCDQHQTVWKMVIAWCSLMSTKLLCPKGFHRYHSLKFSGCPVDETWTQYIAYICWIHVHPKLHLASGLTGTWLY